MSFREKVRKVFQRHKSKDSETGIKIVYYRRSEIPPSKFKGPFDKEHQKRLAAWSFREAQADRPRSLDLPLSPCTTLPDYLRPREIADAAPDQVQATETRIAGIAVSNGVSPTAYHDEFIQDRQGTTGSLSSTTAVDPESFSDSTMTLFLDPLEDETVIKIKESVRTTSPIVRAISPPPLPLKGASMPFAPEDLTRALNAVQIYS
ncbi:hypothetical protein BJX68DRAFT_270467 [Aspergillus pseudodeflectus]|uniref:Clr5 domain-containing protein n=1 Tax=Aspergillus pseudodeflectus TaxID=176178 RepID=A0ABR4JS19_9EURO